MDPAMPFDNFSTVNRKRRLKLSYRRIELTLAPSATYPRRLEIP